VSGSSVTVKLGIDTTRFVAAIAKVGREMARFTTAAHKASLVYMKQGDRRRHVRRCSVCSPYSNPKPLTIDGHAYRARRRNR